MSFKIRCRICKKTVHAILQCSEPMSSELEGYGEERLCLTCKKSTDQITSTRHEENWRGLNENVPEKPNDLYFDNEFLFHDKLSQVPILKNGSVMKLKPINLDGKKVTLINTCPFDSLFQLMLSTYIDRPLFKAQIDVLATENHFFQLISRVAKKGITSQTYKQRLEILYPLFKPNEEPEDECLLLNCAGVIDRLCAQLMKDAYSLRQSYKCENCGHEHTRTQHVLSISAETFKRSDFVNIFEDEVTFTPARCRTHDCNGIVQRTETSTGKT